MATVFNPPQQWWQLMYDNRINPVMVKSETAGFVTPAGKTRKESKVGGYACYFPTREEAVAHARKRLLASIAQAEINLQWDRERLEKFEASVASPLTIPA